MSRSASVWLLTFPPVPHDFGHNALPLIQKEEEVREKMQLLETLIDVEIATNLMKQSAENDEEHDKLKANYNALKTHLVPIEKSSDTFKLLEKYAFPQLFCTYRFQLVMYTTLKTGNSSLTST